jgi:hypothetical protein
MHDSVLPLTLAWREQQQLSGSGRSRRGASEAATLSRALAPRLGLDRLLVGHRGCVNHVQFNESGKHMRHAFSSVCSGMGAHPLSRHRRHRPAPPPPSPGLTCLPAHRLAAGQRF